MAERILGWKLDGSDRNALLERFPPTYAKAVADHVTHGRAGKAPSLPDVREARIIGRADNGDGVEALVVEIAGSSDRWDGSTYHLTWSLGPGREAKESNAVIAEQGWVPIADSPTVRIEAADWP